MKPSLQELIEIIREYRAIETSPLVISRLNDILIHAVRLRKEEDAERKHLLDTLEDVDYELLRAEDTLHGEEGMMVTKARHMLIDVFKKHEPED